LGRESTPPSASSGTLDHTVVGPLDGIGLLTHVQVLIAEVEG
jgi:hypothetical protein